MRLFTAGILYLIAVAPLVTGHGYVAYISIDGKRYWGNLPGRNSIPSPIRTVSTGDPVKGASNRDLACGRDAQTTPEVAEANPGSTVGIKWVNSGGGAWPHFVGPLMTYMASCGSGGCAAFNATLAKWFKIQQAALLPNRTVRTWAMRDVFDGLPVNVTLPSTIAPGEYLIRHEMVGLHNAQTIGGAEFYPSCSQLKIGGSQSGTPAPNSTVSFPGGYSDAHPGIFIDPYDMTGDYPFPGPPVSNFAGEALTENSTAVAATSGAGIVDSRTPPGNHRRVSRFRRREHMS